MSVDWSVRGNTLQYVFDWLEINISILSYSYIVIVSYVRFTEYRFRCWQKAIILIRFVSGLIAIATYLLTRLPVPDHDWSGM